MKDKEINAIIQMIQYINKTYIYLGSYEFDDAELTCCCDVEWTEDGFEIVETDIEDDEDDEEDDEEEGE